jgi:hypothetical protein
LQGFAIMFKHDNVRSSMNSWQHVTQSALAFLPALYRRHAAALGILGFSIYLLTLMGVSIGQLRIDWDIFPYLAIAAERVHTDPVALHAHAFNVVKTNVSPDRFTVLTQDGGYRTQMYTDANGFVSMLGMYRVKWLYCELLTALASIMPPFAAIRLISGVSALVFAGVLLRWLQIEKALALAPIFAALLIVLDFSELARAASPDTLFSALLLGGVFAYVRQYEAATAALLFLAFLARPDNLVFLGIFSTLLLVYRQSRWGVLAAFFASAFVFVPLKIATGHPGWWTQVYVTSIELPTTLVEFHPAFSITLYFTALIKQFLLAVTAQTWVGVFVLGLAAWLVIDSLGFALDKSRHVLMQAVVLSTVAKFILLPIYDTRIYFVYVLVVFLILASKFKELSVRAPEIAVN